MRRVRKAAVLFLATLGALQVAVTCTPVLKWYTRYLTGPAWDNPRGDVLIVLGAESDNDGTIGYGTYWRCHMAIWAWRAGKYDRVIVSGGQGLARSMADFLAAQGVPSSSILLEADSGTTAENARYVASMLKSRPFLRPDLVTSDYHMRRATAAFRKAGLNPSCIPAPDAVKRLNNWPDRWSVLLVLVQETTKLGWYRARGFI